MITKLIRVTILVRDQDEAFRWYRERLGNDEGGKDHLRRP
jgi:catechol 2,3-dioxygenase-like lactoylglutathione lyase family enzyme